MSEKLDKLTAVEEIVSGAVPSLTTVSVWPALVVLGAWLLKATAGLEITTS